MKRLAPETKKDIMHFFLSTATKRILDERKQEKDVEHQVGIKQKTPQKVI